MTWRDDLVEGEFAGIRVYFPESSREFGRRVVNRELPGADEIHSVDLGDRPDVWQVSFFVLGDDYMIDRDELLDELKSPGPYAMIDPWWGEFTVELESTVRCVQSTRRGGMATFTFSVKRAKELAFPVFHLPSGNIKAKIIPVKLAVENNLAGKFSLGKFKGTVLGALGNATIVMGAINGKINSVLGFGSDLSNEIDALNSQLSTLVQTPQILANTMQGLWDSLFQLTNTIRDSIVPFGLDDGSRGRSDTDPVSVLNDIMRDAQTFDAGAGDVSPELAASVDGVLLVESLNAVQDMVKAQTLAAGAASLSELVPDTETTATEMTDTWAGYFDDAIDGADLSYDEAQSLTTLRAAVVDYMVTEAKQAPQISNVFLPAEVPALVLAHRYFQDAFRDEEILRRNSPANPLLVHGNIKVVLDG
jgi:prophage DNA circulation protein